MITAEEARNNVKEFEVNTRPEIALLSSLCESVEVNSKCGLREYRTKINLTRNLPNLLENCERLLKKLGYSVDKNPEDVIGDDCIIYDFIIRW